MPIMINRGNELIRINTEKNRIEYSRSNGASWINRCSTQSCGTFQDLLDNGNEIIATTSKGVYFSRNNGASWVKRS